MKKLLLLVAILFIAGMSGLHAQCTPNVSLTTPGYYPSCASGGFPHDTVGQPYSTILQLRVLTDTSVSGIPATVDSIKLTSVKGLPAGFNYACNPASNVFPGGSNACVLVTGAAPTSGMIGSYPLTIYITIYGKVSGFPASLPDSITCYSITIDPATTGIPALDATLFDLAQNSPNPAGKTTDIYYGVPVASPLEFKMYNLLGKIVYQKSFFAERGVGRITLDVKDYAPGIYMYNLSNGKATLTRRMVLSNN